MPRRFLTAVSAARLLNRCACPDDFILNALVDKVEYVIKIAASKRSTHTMWRVPLFASVPAYSYHKLQQEISAHLRHQGFHVKEFPDGMTIWVSWRMAYQSLMDKKKEQKQHIKKQ